MQSASPLPEAERALCPRFQQVVPERVNAEAHLAWRGRTLTANCLVQIGASPFLLRFDAGRIRECLTHLPLLCPPGGAASFAAPSPSSYITEERPVKRTTDVRPF